MAFETFTETGRSFSTEPKVTLLKQGNFNLNSATMRILQEQKAEFLQLLYDKQTNRIAFKPCAKKDEGAYRLRSSKGGIGQVSGTAFLKFYAIPFSDQTRSIPAQWDAEQGLLVVQL